MDFLLTLIWSTHSYEDHFGVLSCTSGKHSFAYVTSPSNVTKMSMIPGDINMYICGMTRAATGLFEIFAMFFINFLCATYVANVYRRLC